MSRPLIPRPQQQGSPSASSQAIQRSRKISTACGACKQRKTRCTGGNPCEACAARNSQCLYDITADQRRKVANQKNVLDLAEAQNEIEKLRQLLGGVIATIRAGDHQSNTELFELIRTGVDLSQLAAHVRNECRSNYEIHNAFDSIDFTIDSEEQLPSVDQVLNHAPVPGSQSFAGLPQDSRLPQTLGAEYPLYDIDQTQEEDT